MSIAHAAAAQEIRDRPPFYKFILLTLALAADRKGRVEITQDELSLTTGISERSIRTWLAKLDKQGLIARPRAGLIILTL